MMLRRMLEGAEKWALRDLRLDEETSASNSLIPEDLQDRLNDCCYSLALTLAIVIDRADGGQGVD
jgi:hypothetical protein